jgi:tryptophanyl-tRNA synthetase
VKCAVLCLSGQKVTFQGENNSHFILIAGMSAYVSAQKPIKDLKQQKCSLIANSLNFGIFTKKKFFRHWKTD